MTVYVDDSRIPARVGRLNARWSHLFADTQDELHAFAASIGLKRSWFQPGRPHPDGTPSHLWHYDVTDSKREQAIRAGAQPVPWREAAEIMRRRRIADELEAAAQDVGAGEPGIVDNGGSCEQ